MCSLYFDWEGSCLIRGLGLRPQVLIFFHGSSADRACFVLQFFADFLLFSQQEHSVQHQFQLEASPRASGAGSRQTHIHQVAQHASFAAFYQLECIARLAECAHPYFAAVAGLMTELQLCTTGFQRSIYTIITHVAAAALAADAYPGGRSFADCGTRRLR